MKTSQKKQMVAPVEGEQKVKNSKLILSLAFIIPLLILGYVLYLNFMPFGYEKTYTLAVLSDGSIESSSSNFYLSDSKGTHLTSLPQVYGTVFLNIEPKRELNNASLDVSITGPDVYLGTPLAFNSEAYVWTKSFDFSKGIPSSLNGTVVYDPRGKCAYFDNNASLSLLHTEDDFEVGPFAVYAEWEPQNSVSSFQQIIGHYNWELVQNNNSVRFQVGRVNAPNQTWSNLTGAIYTVGASVNESFFGKKHEALAIYSPSEQGYIELWIDKQFAGRTTIGNGTIWREYNRDRPLSLGKSQHGAATYFEGCITKAKFTSGLIQPADKFSQFYASGNSIKIPIIGAGKLESIIVKLNQ